MYPLLRGNSIQPLEADRDGRDWLGREEEEKEEEEVSKSLKFTAKNDSNNTGEYKKLKYQCIEIEWTAVFSRTCVKDHANWLVQLLFLSICAYKVIQKKRVILR